MNDKSGVKIVRDSVMLDPLLIFQRLVTLAWGSVPEDEYHNLRVYFQVQNLKGNDEDLDPTEWGWEVVNDNVITLTTDKLPAPEHIMKVIRCTCKTGCRTSACSCKKVGFECSIDCSTYM